MDKDVTDLVEVGDIDDECLSFKKCVCGKRYDDWEKIINIERAWAEECSECGRRLYFSCKVRVYEIVEGDSS